MLIVRLNPVLTYCLAMDSFRRKFQEFQLNPHFLLELIQLRMVYVHALLP